MLLSRMISIHTPYAGSDFSRAISHSVLDLFQSTLPMQGVTWSLSQLGYKTNISIHTPYAGSDSAGLIVQILEVISIHTPYAGSDIIQDF